MFHRIATKTKIKLKKNTVAVKDGRLRAAARSEGLTPLSERSKKNAKSSRQLGKTDFSPRFNSMAVKGGRLRATARSEGLTLLSERSKKNAKSSRQFGKWIKTDPSPRLDSMAVTDGRLRAAFPSWWLLLASLPPFTAMLLKRGEGPFSRSWRLQTGQRREAFRRGEGSVFPSWRLLLAFFLESRSESLQTGHAAARFEGLTSLSERSKTKKNVSGLRRMPRAAASSQEQPPARRKGFLSSSSWKVLSDALPLLQAGVGGF